MNAASIKGILKKTPVYKLRLARLADRSRRIEQEASARARGLPRLHLGCGEQYFAGYVNIDYPSTEHTVLRPVADEVADLRTLRYDRDAVGEIRLHHVFEHFSRAAACALLTCWSQWLIDGGTLRIEVPDFEATAKKVLSPLTPAKLRTVGLRHIFGSHEAHWAFHADGYSPRGLADLLRAYGFETATIRRDSWRGLHNLEITAHKARSFSRSEAEVATRRWLGQFLVDDTPGELAIMEAWMNEYRSQVDNCWPAA